MLIWILLMVTFSVKGLLYKERWVSKDMKGSLWNHRCHRCYVSVHILNISIPCGLGCNGGRRPETLPFTPVRLLLLNLHPRLNFSLRWPCSSGLLLPTAAGEKKGMEINGVVAISIAVLSNCFKAMLSANFSWVSRTCKYSTNSVLVNTLSVQKWNAKGLFFVFLISVRGSIKVALKLKVT